MKINDYIFDYINSSFSKTSNGIQSNNNMRIDIDNYYENIQDIYDDMDIVLDDNIN